MENDKLKKTLERFGSKGKNRTLLLCALAAGAGVLMLLFADGSGGGEKQATSTAMPDENAYNAQYVADLQANLTSIITKIDGVGGAEVLVTLETGVQYVYATEQKTSGDRTTSDGATESEKSSRETSVVVIDGENGKAPILLQRIEPVVMGVVVVCDGGGSAQVRQAVTDAVTTVCGVGANRVTVTKKSS